MLKKLLAVVLAAVALLGASPAGSAAQKALVYCPVGNDAGGCARIASALAGRFAQVDRGYDGTAGTLDLRTADLDHYALVVVPSLADGAAGRPYGLLREIAPRLRMAATGRVAVFSGAPDQGASNRAAKDAVIANLATWVAAGHTRAVGLVGLLAFQDLSDDAAARYDWVRSVSPVDVSADTELRSFRAVKGRAGAPVGFFHRDGAELAYPNMASYGLHIGERAPASVRSAATGGDGQTVLVTYGSTDAVGAAVSLVAGGDTAWITTDKQDYLPGDTVTFTGGNWAAGDTVRITIHEDPHWVPEHQDRQVVAVAGQDGKFSNRSFVVHTNDFGVTFTSTAVATPSGKTAGHVFTDGNSAVTGTVSDQVTGSPLAGVTVSCGIVNGCNGSYSTTTGALGEYTLGANYSGNSNTISLTFSKVGYTTLTTSTFCLATNTQNATATCPTTTDKDASLVPIAVATTTTVDAASATYGDASVTLTATVTPASGPAVGAGSVTFTLKQGLTPIGSPSTDNSVVAGAASVTYSLPAGTAAGGYTVEASYTPGTGFGGSSGSGALTIAKATTTTTVACTGGPFIYNTAYQTPCSATVTGPGGLNATVTPVNYTDNRNAGTATASASYAGTTNYEASSDTENFTIGKASTTVTLTCPVSVPYTGTARESCSASAQFSYGVTATMTPTYSNNVDVGTATATATYTESANHLGDSKTKTFAITPVAVTASITASGKPYDATTSVVGTVGCSVSGVLAIDNGNVGCTASGASFDAADAGSRTVSATVALTGSAAGNYALTSTSASVGATITKIDATINVSGFSGQFDGAPHGATGTATGVGGADLSGLLNLGASYTNVPGGTANWSFSGNTNYNAANGSVSIVITKAPSVTDVTCTAGPFTYNAAAHTPCSVSVTGAGGLSLDPDPTYANNVDAGTASASYTYAGDANHDGSSDTQSFTIAKADQTITWSNPGNITYGTALGGTQLNASVAGVAGGSAPGALTYIPTAGTVLGAGSHSLEVEAAETSNYKRATKTVTLVVDKKPVTPSVTAQNKTYDGTTTATITSCTVAVKVGTDDVACVEAAANFASDDYGVGTTVTATGISLTGNTAGNYSLTGTTATTTANIDRAPLTITAANQSKVWDGTPFTAFSATYAGLVTGDHTANVPNAGVLTGSLSFSGSATAAVDAGTYTITPGGYATPNGNYTITYVAGVLTIVDQTAPKATILELNPVPVGTAATLKVNVDDRTTGNSKITEWKYTIDGGGESSLSIPLAQQSSNVNVQVSLPIVTSTDVQTICVWGKDAGNNWSVQSCALLAVYDPSAGFVTGGGWITAEAGSCAAHPDLPNVCTGATGGRANFGFVSKYQKGQQTPSGNTEFQFQAGNLNFKSTEYEWLVVQGTSQAQFKGTGAINGVSGFQFIITAVDGDAFNGTKKPDAFRIKITKGSAVVFDNKQGATETNLDAVTTLGGGSIVIHSK